MNRQQAMILRAGMSRRRVLSGAAMLSAGGVLAACAGGGSNPTPAPSTISALAAAAFGAIASEAQLALPQLEQAGLNLGQAPQVKQWLSAIAQAAAGITASSTQAQGQSALQVIETDANDIAPIVETIAPLIPGGSIIGLVFAALPEIEVLINLGSSLLAPVVQQVAKTAPPAPAAVRLGAGPDVSRVNQLIAAARGR